MLFDRTVRSTMEREGDDYIFSCIGGVLKDADLVVANLEGPITAFPSVSLGSEIGSPDNYTFTFPVSTGRLLMRHKIRLVNLGNNHILNFGLEGARATTQFLLGAGVDYFGDPMEQRVAEETVNGVKLAFINYNEFAPGGWRNSASTTLEQIRSARQENLVPVVYTHWGDEYVAAPERVKELAHSFIDAGAAIVIGSHPHVVQENETYKGKYIYYSLGNFIFDQYWNESVRRGLLLHITFTQAGVERLEEIPIDNQSGPRPCAV